MLKKYLIKKKGDDDERIKWRSHEVTRIEAFSDSVLGFVMSLLIISLEVPKDSRLLFESLVGFIPFAFLFMIIFWIWRLQYKFFRRYGLHDRTTLALNAVLLFFVLFFVYPIKFLLSAAFLGNVYVIRPEDHVPMVILYNGGFAVITLIFAAMYVNALRRADEIKLTPVEVFETKTFLWRLVLQAQASVVAVIFAYAVKDTRFVEFCYFAYFLLGIELSVFQRLNRKAFKKKFGNIPIAEPQHGTVE